MQFSRTTVETFRADWIRRDFCTMTPEFRAIRAGARKKMNGCFKCRHKFKDGEMMALGSFGKRGNNVLCQACAEYLLSLFGSATKESLKPCDKST